MKKHGPQFCERLSWNWQNKTKKMAARPTSKNTELETQIDTHIQKHTE